MRNTRCGCLPGSKPEVCFPLAECYQNIFITSFLMTPQRLFVLKEATVFFCVCVCVNEVWKAFRKICPKRNKDDMDIES